MTMERRVFASFLLLLAIGAMPVHAADTDKLLPDDTEVVVSVNVKQLLTAPVLQPLLAKVKEKVAGVGELAKAQEEIGFDPMRDVERVTLAMGRDQRKVLVLVQGTFNAEKIHAKAPAVAKEKKDILKINSVGSYTIYEVKPPEENRPMFLAVVDNGLLVLSQDQATVVDALERKAGKKTAVLKKDLQELLTKTETQPSITLTALTGPLAATGLPVVEKIKTIVGNLAITDEVKVELVFTTREAKDAKSVAAELNENLEQVKALVENAAQVDNRLQPAVEAITTLKATAEGSAVTVKGFLSKDVLASLNKLLPK